ncbi:uncharacterized protein BT62DRAFT_741643 [Guyanagaster necrorhizus]|uniref:Uncharacterized protein n=1 Tax=Guyanagaster necrorhizus TaxID=856835 RepID=A0A9P8AUC6_9AGAR|nr:uncharacterized protein BT62DRAFT_741643 [Guyanagaster necrorhizus MCA 3950]KAG7447906.1 hypothetical protein BT62DRAFT_741643 [Guyanagaster necrorhizus MCA 3950]
MSAHKVWLNTGANTVCHQQGDSRRCRPTPETMTKLQAEYTEDRLLVVKVNVSKPDEVNAAFGQEII